MKQKIKLKANYIIIPLAVAAVAFLGGQLTSKSIASGWYETINKPTWTPPGSVIGAVWTTIFILSTISILLFFNKASRSENQRKKFNYVMALFAINGALNVFWSFLFFTKHALGAAVIEAAVLGASVICLIALIWNKSNKYLKASALLLVPYALWVSFATYLTYIIYVLN